MNVDLPYPQRLKVLLKRMAADRTVKTFVLALMLIAAMGLLRPDKPEGVPGKRFWAMKISWKDYADIVVTGDSRVLGGISPARMEKTLSGRRIVNYGFVNNLYDPEYLDAIDQVLRARSEFKTVILGITPHSLTDDPDILGQFSELKRLSKRDLFMDIHFAGLMDFFDYMSFRDALLGLFPGLAKSHTRREFFADGWLAYSKHPPGEKRELKKYRRMYEKCRVSPAVVDNVMNDVTRWTASGIRVYGVLIPTCREMVALENALSGFNRADFADAFRAAGGVWIDMDQAAYDSFDGSHLQRQSALEFSDDLASRILKIEQQSETACSVD